MMTKDERLKFFEEQETRLVEVLKNADPLSEEYDRALSNLFSVQYELEPEEETLAAVVGFSAETKTTVFVGETAEGEAPEPKPEHPAYDFAFVRGRLSNARSEKGIDITVIFDELGYENLSSVPKDDYWKLMEALDKALEEKS